MKVPDGMLGQWVERIQGYSVQYDAVRWAAKNLCGPPRVFTLEHNYGDIRGSFTQPYGTQGTHWVEFFVAEPVIVASVHIYETYNPGAVTRIAAWDYGAEEWVSLWTGAGRRAPPVSRIFAPPLANVDMSSDLFRLEIDVDSVPGYNEIDCVRVIGVPLNDELRAELEAKAARARKLKAFEAAVDSMPKRQVRTDLKSKKGKFAALSLAVDVNAANAWFAAGTEPSSAVGPASAGSLAHPFEMHIRAGILTPKAVLAQSIKNFRAFDANPLPELVRAAASRSLAKVKSVLQANPGMLSRRPPPESLDMHTVYISAVNGYSAQYDTSNWAATNVIGAPRVYPQYGDIAGAWAQPYNSQNIEWIDVSIERELWITSIDVYETYNPGAITHIQAWDNSAEAWVDLYVDENPRAAPAVSRIFTPTLTLPQFPCSRLKLVLNCAAVNGYNEIDAIQVHGGTCENYVPPAVTPARDVGSSSSRGGPETPASFRAFDVWQRSPLLVAIRTGLTPIVSYLIAYGADVARKSLYGYSPLAWAIMQDTKQPIVYTLLAHPAVHAPYKSGSAAEYALNDHGETVLHLAVKHDDPKLVALLLALESFDPTLESSAGLTPLAMATSGRVRAVFAEAGGAASSSAELPASLADAAATGSVLTVKRVLDRDGVAAAAATDDRGRTALFHALDARADEVTALLLASRVSVDCADHAGNTPLMRAAASGSAAAVAMLLTRSVTREAESATAVNANGDTVLHCGARSGSAEVVELLLAFDGFGAAAGMANNQGLTPIGVCSSGEAAAVLEAAGAGGSWDGSEGRVCAVCFMAPPLGSEGMVWRCECNAEFCEECFVHMAKAALHDGEFPQCCNAACEATVPMSVLRKALPVSELLLVAAVMVNESYDTDGAYRTNCSVCSRINDIRDVLASGSARFQCDHCGVYCCAVCEQIHPRRSPPRNEQDVARNAMDDEIHAGCVDKFGSLQKFLEFYALVTEKAMRKCPTCGEVGIKDDACCHLHCVCGNDYCYLCARNRDQLHGTSVSTHSTYGSEWQTDTEYCWMYAHHSANIDPRVAALGCGQAGCRPSGSCPSDATCRVERDRFANALMATIRVRCAVLDFMRRMGKSDFVAMITRFGWRDLVNNQYFDGKFPLDTLAEDDVPDWLEYEPENVREFYGARLHWFIHENDIPEYERVLTAWRESGGAPVGWAIGGESANPEPAADDDVGTSAATAPPPAPPMPADPVINEPPLDLPDRFVFNAPDGVDDGDDRGRRRRGCAIM
ncbi:ankyrin [Thecamonas trahens ATCC 50062]|uniref:Ankyrin n=1 Tax=Thecamonas trahens ATCC 50062 TaxID=461836 RepID=A0A0L0DJ29_THETB|nr:ankyrin [Thecamonas trahens ATCC 50062]KNC51338.1 ankyrin [Thecamonas trahens ATCC 50062]|eukprot:XP_013756258.1 ankyrin [Thecamonas trahens ATCC 50062]